MLWNELLRKGNVSLLEAKSGTQYCVCRNYNPIMKEDQQYDDGKYFCHWANENRKAKTLSDAVDYFRVKTEGVVIEECLDSRTIGAILLDITKDMDHFDYAEHEEDAIGVLESEIERLKIRCPELFTVLEIIALMEE